LRGLGYDPPPEQIPLLTNAVHWSYGSSLGVAYAFLPIPRGAGSVTRGIVFGTIVWAASYVELVPLGIYEPPWHYPARTLAKDIGYHLVYGLGVAATDRLLLVAGASG
jgi:uncharacterized membrane protein YagU involved in acid resistance